MATLFPPGSIEFDQDLLEQSSKRCETKVKIGMSLGRATGRVARAGVDGREPVGSASQH